MELSFKKEVAKCKVLACEWQNIGLTKKIFGDPGNSIW